MSLLDATLVAPVPETVEQWSRLRKKRPRLRKLLGEDLSVIGHTDLRIELLSRLDLPETAVLFLISGGKGSGKSAIVQWLERMATDRVVTIHQGDQTGQSSLDPDGNDLIRLINGIRDRVDRAGRNALLVYDDAHRDLREAGIRRFVPQAIEQLDLGFLVIFTTTPLTPDFSPIPTRVISLDHRQVDFEEFDGLLRRTLDAAHAAPEAFSEPLRHSLHELSQQTSDFTAVHYIIEMLLAGHLDTKKTMRPNHLYRLLVDVEPDEQVRTLPAVRRSDDRWMTFRRKDKTELLADLLMRTHPDRSELAEAVADSFPDVDPTVFLDERTDYRESVMSLCLTRSPLDLVRDLLGPKDIRNEVKLLELDPSQLFGLGEGQANLLVRGLGFTFADRPKGLEAYREAIDEAARIGSDRNSRSDILKGLHDTVIKQVEFAMRDLLHFWGSYLFGSVRNLVDDVNQRRRGKQLVMHRLQLGEIVDLLRHLDRSSKSEDAAFKLSLVNLRRPLSDEFLRSCTEFTRLRNEFTHDPRSDYPDELRESFIDLVSGARNLLENATAGFFPAVIKLSEIMFDEYGRKIFSGIDSYDNPVRFALTDEVGEELEVASFYYVLPLRPVSVNPLIVPRFGAASPVLFEFSQDYGGASGTQRRQGYQLLKLVDFAATDRVVDVGCGTGELALEIAQMVPQGSIHGIDVSQKMIHGAEERLAKTEIKNATFAVANLLEYHADGQFDVVVSNSSMHWILPPEQGYRQLFQLLRPGGRLAVHQGGDRSYRGLWECARRTIIVMGFERHFANWTYPVYYPTVDAYRHLLENVGFTDISIESDENDGSEYPDLIRDFSQAGLLPFLSRLPETYQDTFRAAFLRQARRERPDLFTHRLFVVAIRP